MSRIINKDLGLNFQKANGTFADRRLQQKQDFAKVRVPEVDARSSKEALKLVPCLSDGLVSGGRCGKFWTLEARYVESDHKV